MPSTIWGLATACGEIQVAPWVKSGGVRANQQGLWGAEVAAWSEPKDGRTNSKTWDLALGTDHDRLSI